MSSSDCDKANRVVVMEFLDKHPSVYILIATVVVLLILACYAKCKGKRNLCEIMTSHKNDPTPAIVISNPVFLRPEEAQTIIPGFVTDADDDDDDSESSDEDEVELRNADRSYLPRMNVASRAGRSIQLPIINSSDSSSSSTTLRSSWNFTRITKNKRTGSGTNISLTETADDIIYDSMRSIGPMS